MSEIQDSAAIIAADMRQLADDIAAGRAIVGQSVWRSYADRVEAIGTGNIAKQREALKDIVRLVEQIRLLYSDFPHEIHDIARKARAALAAPPRNCDVGTAEEQAERLHRFCISQDCATCPCDIGKADGRCEFAWAQIPYEEGGAK